MAPSETTKLSKLGVNYRGCGPVGGHLLGDRRLSLIPSAPLDRKDPPSQLRLLERVVKYDCSDTPEPSVSCRTAHASKKFCGHQAWLVCTHHWHCKSRPARCSKKHTFLDHFRKDLNSQHSHDSSDTLHVMDTGRRTQAQAGSIQSSIIIAGNRKLPGTDSLIE